MAMGANYSFELIFNETCAPQFNGHNNSFLASGMLTLGTCMVKNGQKYAYIFTNETSNGDTISEKNFCYRQRCQSQKETFIID
jgi:hypothetical protein